MRDALGGIGVVGAAIACCAVLPLAVGAIGGLALGAAAGWGLVLVTVILFSVALIARRHRGRPAR